MAANTPWSVATPVIRKSSVSLAVKNQPPALARACARAQALAWYMFAALIHSAAFLPGGDMGILGIYLLSLLALGVGHLVTKRCIEHVRNVDRQWDR